MSNRRERQEYLGSINFAGNALLNLINDVLDLSRLEADQVELDCRPVDVKRAGSGNRRSVQAEGRGKESFPADDVHQSAADSLSG